MPCTLKCFILSLVIFLQIAISATAQKTSFPIERWKQKLNVQKDINNNKSDPDFQQKADYLQQAFYTTADIYRSIGKTDSFNHYF